MNNIGLFYGSVSGNTETVAKKIGNLLELPFFHIHNVAKATPKDLEKYENIIIGVPTWGNGVLEGVCKDFLTTLKNANLTNKKVAIFGLGDAKTYAYTFVDGLAEVYAILVEKNCDLVGFVPNQNYNFKQSKALIDNKFIGLPIDEDNEPHLTDSRIEKWIEQINEEFESW